MIPRSLRPFSSKSLWILYIPLIGFVQFHYGSAQSIAANQFTQRGPVSSENPTQQSERRQFNQRQRYPQDLPPFFSGGHDDDDRGSGPYDNQNVGFAPPKGFPSFEDIEADFPKFGGVDGRPGSPSRDEPQYYSKPPRRPHPSFQPQGDFHSSEEGGTGPNNHFERSPIQGQYSHGPNSISPPGGPFPFGGGRGSSSRRPGPGGPPPPSAYHHQQNQHHNIDDAPPFESQGQHSEEYSGKGRPQYDEGNYNRPDTSFQHLAAAHTHSDPKRPIVLKVSGLKNNYYQKSKLPAGPEVFYAPSPDVQAKRQKQNSGHNIGHHRGHQHHLKPQPAHNPLYHHQEQEDNDYQGHGSSEEHQHQRRSPYNRQTQHGPQRYRRDAESSIANSTVAEKASQSVPSKTSKTSSKSKSSGSPKKTILKEKSLEIDPMVADGSEQDNFWDLTSPFIMFDTYKKHNHNRDEDEAATEEESDHSSHHLPIPLPLTSSSASQLINGANVTFHDSTSEEQRFFPSFPSPYLGLSPFGGGGISGSPARAPLFPGPSANRAPSRYHPATFAGLNKYASAPSHPNRGPSSVAASHDRYQDNNLLGSGNFEVVRGGTYYGEDDEGPSYHHGSTGGGGGSGPSSLGGGQTYHDDDDGYFHHNGHSSPYRGGGGDFFANFRDFADINPHSRSFSHNHETHHLAASELSSQKKTPNNIFDKLELETASSGDSQPQFSMEYDPMMATF